MATQMEKTTFKILLMSRFQRNLLLGTAANYYIKFCLNYPPPPQPGQAQCLPPYSPRTVFFLLLFFGGGGVRVSVSTKVTHFFSLDP
jgi:hypothetical protein